MHKTFFKRAARLAAGLVALAALSIAPQAGAVVLGPTVTSGNIFVTGSPTGTAGAYRLGDQVTVTWHASGEGSDFNTFGTTTSASADLSAWGGSSSIAMTNIGACGSSTECWQASYTVSTEGTAVDTTTARAQVSATNIGGTTGPVQDAHDGPFTVDNRAPVVTAPKITVSGATGTDGAFKIDDTVLVRWDYGEGGDGNFDALSSVQADLSGWGGSATATMDVNGCGQSDGRYYACYQVSNEDGAIDTTTAHASLTATDNAGNSTTTADDQNFTVDNRAPKITGTYITVSGATGTGGAFKIGDTAIVRWHYSGEESDGNLDVVSATADLSPWGGSDTATMADQGCGGNAEDGVLEACYTVSSEDSAIDTASAQTSVTATDDAGNQNTGTDNQTFTVDNQPPTVTAGYITVEGATGTDSAFRDGDTVIVRWHASGVESDGNTDLSGATADLSAWGGSATTAMSDAGCGGDSEDGILEACHTLSSEDDPIDALNAKTSVTATDDAGNATTTEDDQTFSVDNMPPHITPPHITISGDDGVVADYTVSQPAYVGRTLDGDATGVTFHHSDDQYGIHDEGISDAIAIPFAFSFFGTAQSHLYLSTDGFVSFTGNDCGPNSHDENGVCWSNTEIPKGRAPHNAIFAHWKDFSCVPTDPSDHSCDGSVKYETFGATPNRTFVVEYNDIQGQTFQAILHETSNVVDIESNGETDNFTQGLEDASGKRAAFLPGRNAAEDVTLENDAVRFTPTTLPVFSNGDEVIVRWNFSEGGDNEFDGGTYTADLSPWGGSPETTMTDTGCDGPAEDGVLEACATVSPESNGRYGTAQVTGVDDVGNVTTTLDDQKTYINDDTSSFIERVDEFDTNHDGKIDEVTLKFNEPMLDSSLDPSRFTIGGVQADTFVASPTNTRDGGFANDNTVTIAVAGGVAGTERKAIGYSGGEGGLTDLAGNHFFGGTILATDERVNDDALPVILSVTPTVGANTAAPSANVVVQFSEPMLTGEGFSFTDSLIGQESYGVPSWNETADQVTLSHSTPWGFCSQVILNVNASAVSNEDSLFADGPVSNPWNFRTMTSSEGPCIVGGGSSVPASVTVVTPNGGETYAAGTMPTIVWSGAGSKVTAYRVSLSTNGGSSYSVIADNLTPSGFTPWTVPSTATTTARVRVQALGDGGAVLAADDSDANFTITTPSSGGGGGGSDTNKPGGSANPSNGTDNGLHNDDGGPNTGSDAITGSSSAHNALSRDDANRQLPSGSPVDTLVKLACGEHPGTDDPCRAVYYIGLDAKRHSFGSTAVFMSWYKDFSQVKTIDPTSLSAIPLGAPVLIRPGTLWVKITSDPKTYYVEPGYKLRWIKDEATAMLLGGAHWNQNIVDVDPTFFTLYGSGADMDQTTLASDWPRGALVQLPTDSHVWYVTTSGRRQIQSADAFNANMFQTRFVNVGTAAGWQALTPGTPIAAFEDGLFSLQH